MKTNKFLYVAILAISLVAFGCKKSYLDTTPNDSVTDENLYDNAAGCRSVLDGMARLMSTTGAALSTKGSTTSHDDFGHMSIVLQEDVMSADVVCAANDYDWFGNLYKFQTHRNALYRDAIVAWALYYKLINSANLLLANIDKATGDANELNEIRGEAYAWRAWCYSKLAIYYCKTYSLGLNSPGVPVYTTPTTSTTKGNPRGTVGDVYDRITIDIDSAIALIEGSGIITTNKSYISLATAYGIHAEVSLVMNKWADAEKYSDLAIQTVGGASKLMDSTTYRNSGFRDASNSEWMWASQLSASQTDDYGIICFMSFVDASNPSSYAGGGGTFRKIPKYLFDMIKTGDVRKTTFDNTRKQRKFYMVDYATWVYDNLYMRLAEMYLIKAEAQAQQNEADAVTTLETLVKKRNADYSFATTPYTGGTNLLEEIYLQRRIELFLEGKAFSDMVRLQKPLKRPLGTGNFDLTTCGVSDLPANSNEFLFKIPQSEMDNNANMTGSDQNP
jgi:hypothetical protein